MADLSITPASVAQGTGAVTRAGTAGETITAGQLVYLKSSDGRFWLADANDTSATATAVGIALHASLAGQPLLIQTGGEITIGATVTIGQTYLASVNAGGIAPVSDLASSSYVTYVGYGKTVAILTMNLLATAIQRA